MIDYGYDVGSLHVLDYTLWLTAKCIRAWPGFETGARFQHNWVTP